MSTRTAAYNVRNDTTPDARNGRRAFSSETRLTCGSRDEDVESVFSSLSYLLEGDEPSTSLSGAASDASDEEAIEVEDSELIEIGEIGDGWHESGPASVTARVVVDPHVLATLRPERMEIPAAARRPRTPNVHPQPRYGLTPLMATLTAAASAAPPEVTPVPEAATRSTPPQARRWPAPPAPPPPRARPPRPPRPLPRVEPTPLLLTVPQSQRERPRFLQASPGVLVSAVLIAAACGLALLHVQQGPSPASRQPAAPAVAPASVAAPAPALVAAPPPVPTPATAERAVGAPALSVRPLIRVPGPMPVVEPRTVATHSVAEPPPPALPSAPAPGATVKHDTIPSTGPVLLEDR